MKKIDYINEIIRIQKENKKGVFSYVANMHDLCDCNINELNIYIVFLNNLINKEMIM